jgi:hypothetical protein
VLRVLIAVLHSLFVCNIRCGCSRRAEEVQAVYTAVDALVHRAADAVDSKQLQQARADLEKARKVCNLSLLPFLQGVAADCKSRACSANSSPSRLAHLLRRRQQSALQLLSLHAAIFCISQRRGSVIKYVITHTISLSSVFSLISLLKSLTCTESPTLKHCAAAGDSSAISQLEAAAAVPHPHKCVHGAARLGSSSTACLRLR